MFSIVKLYNLKQPEEERFIWAYSTRGTESAMGGRGVACSRDHTTVCHGWKGVAGSGRQQRSHHRVLHGWERGCTCYTESGETKTLTDAFGAIAR